MFNWLTNPEAVTAVILWFGAICTMGLYTMLFRENKVYRFFEHMFIGLASGYTVVITWKETLTPHWWEPMVNDGYWVWFFALPFSLFFYMVFSRKYNWMSRLAVGMVLGYSAGLSFQQVAGAYFPQIYASFKPLAPRAAQGPFKAVTFFDALNNWIFVAIMICVMTYFFFAFEQKSKGVRSAANAGRLILMVAFGAIFGSTIMARMSLFIDRLQFMIFKFGDRPYGVRYGFQFTFLLIALIIALYFERRSQARAPGDEAAPPGV